MNSACDILSIKRDSNYFSVSSFKRLLRDYNRGEYFVAEKRKSKKSSGKTFSAFLDEAYRKMLDNYRNEYVFKNNLFLNLVRKYGLDSTVVFNEFVVGGSIADFVFLNGEIRIFEIKTNYDKLDKLGKQLADYFKFADKVYVVGTPDNRDALLNALEHSRAGLVIFDEDNQFIEVKNPQTNRDLWCHETIFKTLHKPEYTGIISRYYGIVPDVPNTLFFKACLELAKNMDLEYFQQETLHELKGRKISNSDPSCENIPDCVKFIGYQLNMNESQLTSFRLLLNQTV